MNAEQQRMATVGQPEEGLEYAGPWYTWGPYLSERAWGTVREDYSADGDAWRSFPHDHARSRAYRWSEDGLAGICTLHQDLCLALGLWNGRDPILKERLFGLTGHEGNHGEDAKEYWWYLDATPSHSWLRWRYHYPQSEFPYDDLVAENARRSREEREYELLDTGAFEDDRYWVVEVTYAKAGPTDVLMQVDVTNAGPERRRPARAARRCGSATPGRGRGRRPGRRRPTGTRRRCCASRTATCSPSTSAPAPTGSPPRPARTAPRRRRCSATTRPTSRGCSAQQPTTPYPKDGINDHVVSGAATVDPHRTGTKAAWWYRSPSRPGRPSSCGCGCSRPRPATSPTPAWAGSPYERTIGARRSEADTYYAELAPPGTSPERAALMRTAFAGMIWGKQFYRYDVAALARRRPR